MSGPRPGARGGEDGSTLGDVLESDRLLDLLAARAPLPEPGDDLLRRLSGWAHVVDAEADAATAPSARQGRRTAVTSVDAIASDARVVPVAPRRRVRGVPWRVLSAGAAAVIAVLAVGLGSQDATRLLPGSTVAESVQSIEATLVAARLAAEDGDVVGARLLLERARELVAGLDEDERGRFEVVLETTERGVASAEEAVRNGEPLPAWPGGAAAPPGALPGTPTSPTGPPSALPGGSVVVTPPTPGLAGPQPGGPDAPGAPPTGTATPDGTAGVPVAPAPTTPTPGPAPSAGQPTGPTSGPSSTPTTTPTSRPTPRPTTPTTSQPTVGPTTRPTTQPGPTTRPTQAPARTQGGPPTERPPGVKAPDANAPEVGSARAGSGEAGSAAAGPSAGRPPADPAADRRDPRAEGPRGRATDGPAGP